MQSRDCDSDNWRLDGLQSVQIPFIRSPVSIERKPVNAVSHTRGNMYKLQKMSLSMILENILLKELLTCGTLYHPW